MILGFSDSADMIALFLILGVIFVNGFTDAPNTISGIVSSGIWSLKKACFISGIFNLVGVILFSVMGGKVAKSIFESTDLGEYESHAICACLIGVIAFSTVCWMFKMPSSESHALICCIYGASCAIHSSSSGGSAIISILILMLIFCFLSALLAIIFSSVFKKNAEECTGFEVIACIVSSLLHGAQDGQKFVALIMMLMLGKGNSGLFAPISVYITVGAVMMLGTLMGGGRILDSLGNDLVQNNERIAFISDATSTVSVLVCSLLGIPVSTSNIKACSLIGAGYREGAKINSKTAKKLVGVSVITFPVCAVAGYILTKLFILLF